MLPISIELCLHLSSVCLPVCGFFALKSGHKTFASESFASSNLETYPSPNASKWQPSLSSTPDLLGEYVSHQHTPDINIRYNTYNMLPKVHNWYMVSEIAPRMNSSLVHRVSVDVVSILRELLLSASEQSLHPLRFRKTRVAEVGAYQTAENVFCKCSGSFKRVVCCLF